MDQAQLREREARCTQEEPPRCQAACPLHVDVRAFMGQMAAGDLPGARKTLERTLPLAGVLGLICDQPCRQACLRGQAGSVLETAALERACILGAPNAPRPLVLPGKGQKTAVLGGGMAALAAAWDLARKGCAVTVLHPGGKPGGRLLGLDASLLPPAALEAELGRLTRMGVAFEASQPLDGAALAELAATFDAVFVEHEAAGGHPGLCPARREDVDPVTLAFTGLPGVFCGGWPGEGGAASVMQEAADGRRAANSMDRHMAGASVTASREKEGPQATRLFTSLDGVEPSSAVRPADAALGYSVEEARAEAARCLQCQCLECVKVCAYMERYKGYPRTYVRQMYNNEAIVKGVHQANRMINTCSLCGLCEKVCPEGFSMAELCLETRQGMVARGQMPPSTFDFALRDMAWSNGPECSLARPDPATGACAHLFFPGCQLAASRGERVLETYAHLRGALPGGVGLMLRCCGAPAHWAGEAARFEAALGELLAAWEGLGRPRVVCACASCLAMLRQHAPQVEAVSLWQVLAGEAPPPRSAHGVSGPLAVHDPCTAREDAASRQAVRALLTASGVAVTEPPLNGEFTECCGYGGLMSQADPAVAHEVTRRRAASVDAPFAASCAMCRDRLAAEGKPAHHLLDILFSSAQGPPDPSAKGPGLSARQEERARLKARALVALWEEEAAAPAPSVRLEVSDELAARMDERRILLEDVRRAVAEAERTGRKFVDRSTGAFLASLRPARVTYWVEYAPAGDGFALRRVYSHRMVVPGAGGAQKGDE